MMKILSFETSTEYCSIALWQDGDILNRFEHVGQRHSELIMEMMSDLLEKAGVTLSELNGIAYGAGPGSFTGVRIACGITQGLALGADLPVVGVSTLQALAQAAGFDKVIAALDARMGEIYHAAYEKRSGVWVMVCEPNLCMPHQAPCISGNGWFCAGSGFAMHGEVLEHRYAGQIIASNPQAIPQAGAIAELAVPLFIAGQGMDASHATPVYLRDKVALKTSER